MKRLTGLFLTMTLAVAMTISAGATQAITFDDSGKGTVTQKEEKKEEEKKEEEKKEESKKSDEGGISAIIDSIFGGDNKEDSASGRRTKKDISLSAPILPQIRRQPYLLQWACPKRSFQIMIS